MTLKSLVAGLVVGALLLSACGDNSDDGDVAEAGDSLSLCVIHNNADHPSIAAIVRGMDEEAANYGAEVTYFDPAFDPQRQASMIEDCIARGPDVIVINAVDPDAVVPGIQAANQAGIPVIMQNAGTTEEAAPMTATFVGTRAYDQGYSVGLMMAEELDGQGNIVAILGRLGQTDVVRRMDGLQAGWADGGANFDLIAEQPADWSKDQALTVMQDLLTRFQDIDGVFALDDPMALGALEAIKAAGREGDIKVFGVNGNTEACESVAAGEMGGTALQLSDLVGAYTVRAAHDVVNGRLVPPEILAPSAPVTPGNVNEWMDSCW